MAAADTSHRAVPGGRAGGPGLVLLVAFGAAAFGVGLARAVTTTYLPVLLDAIERSPGLIGVVMLVNPIAGFATPLAVGLWSDRRPGTRARVPFLIGGALLASGGLVAIAAGTATSYLVLAAAGLVTYVGLSGALTAHRAAIVARFDDDARPAATSAQELQRSAGTLLGLVAGGVLLAASSALPFVVAAVVVAVLLVPTVLVLRRVTAAEEAGDADRREHPRAHVRDLLDIARQPGAREVLAAQTLWVLAYVALPTFFILYAEEVLGVGPPTSSFALGGVALLAGAGMLVAGKLDAKHVRPAVIGGALALGGGLLVAAPFDELGIVVGPFCVAAFGFGLVNALGFPYFSRFLDDEAAGRLSGVYFSARAIAAAVALPLAGGLAALTGSYRAILLQGAAALLAVVPLLRTRPPTRDGGAGG